MGSGEWGIAASNSFHWDGHMVFVRTLDGFMVTGVDVSEDSEHGVVGEDALEAFGCGFGSVCDDDLSCVLAETDADASAVVE